MISEIRNFFSGLFFRNSGIDMVIIFFFQTSTCHFESTLSGFLDRISSTYIWSYQNGIFLPPFSDFQKSFVGSLKVGLISEGQKNSNKYPFVAYFEKCGYPKKASKKLWQKSPKKS